MRSASRTASRTTAWSRMLPSRKVNAGEADAASRLVSDPVDRSSSTTTSSPIASRWSVRWLPMKPAPPVTTVRMVVPLVVRSEGVPAVRRREPEGRVEHERDVGGPGQVVLGVVAHEDGELGGLLGR